MKDEVEGMGIHPGCVLTYPDEFSVLNGDKFVCRAIDNRIGGFMVAEVARLFTSRATSRTSACMWSTRCRRKSASRVRP